MQKYVSQHDERVAVAFLQALALAQTAYRPVTWQTGAELYALVARGMKPGQAVNRVLAFH